MFNLGFTEILLLGILALIFIGPKQFSEIARTLGRVLNELKRAQSDLMGTIISEIRSSFPVIRFSEDKESTSASSQQAENPHHVHQDAKQTPQPEVAAIPAQETDDSKRTT